MNAPIVRLFIGVLVLFALLVGFTSNWAVFDADELAAKSQNKRPLFEAQQIERGKILTADGEVIAESKPKGKGDQLRYVRRYPLGSLFGNPVGYSFLTEGQTGLEQTQQAGRSRAIADLGADHVLFFFYRSDCPYCHAFAPILAAFQARHGIQVVAVSMDGGPMPGFPEARPDNGIATTLKVTQVPAIFLAQPFTGRITPIGFGVLSESQLLERLAIVSTPQGEAMLPSATRQIDLR